MTEFFQTLWDTILAPFKILILIFTVLIELIGVAVNYLTAIVSFLPEWMLLIVVVLIFVSVLYKIIGRE